LKKFDIEEYTTRRIREMNGAATAPSEVDKEISGYTTRRIREIRGESVYRSDGDTFIGRYCALRIRELKLERYLRDRKLLLDNRKLGSYTVVTMGDRDGET
jgi:hypothetical protein